MSDRTRLVIGIAVGLIALVTAAVLFEMFGTILLSITVAYVLVPIQRRFLDRGWSRRRAAIATTSLAIAAVVAVVVPLAYVAFTKRDVVTTVLAEVPESIDITVASFSASVATADAVDLVVAYLPALILDAALFLSAMSIKLALFAIVVFGLLVGHEKARRGALAPVPPTYQPFVEALETRARETLTALLVLQVGTALMTFVIAIPTFWILGYDHVVVLSVFAGVLQFLPIIGPIVLLLAMGGFHVAAGEIAAAALVIIVGGILVGWLPDLLVRPRLARYTAGMSGTLYFVGFIGGIASLGVIGILAGPLLVALLVEGVDHLAAQMPHTDQEPTTASTD